LSSPKYLTRCAWNTASSLIWLILSEAFNILSLNRTKNLPASESSCRLNRHQKKRPSLKELNPLRLKSSKSSREAWLWDSRSTSRMAQWLSTISFRLWKLWSSSQFFIPEKAWRNTTQRDARPSQQETKSYTKNWYWRLQTGSNLPANLCKLICTSSSRFQSLFLRNQCRFTWWNLKRELSTKKKFKYLETASAFALLKS